MVLLEHTVANLVLGILNQIPPSNSKPGSDFFLSIRLSPVVFSRNSCPWCMMPGKLLSSLFTLMMLVIDSFFSGSNVPALSD